MTVNDGKERDVRGLKLEHLDSAYDNLEKCFHPLMDASVALRAAGFHEVGEAVKSAANIVQRVQDFVLENSKLLRFGEGG